MIGILSICATLIAIATVRLAFVRRSQASHVDHYYWLLAAGAYRRAKQLPAVIRGKYLLEDERQGYPPFFGALLAQFSGGDVQRWGRYLPLLVDGLVAGVLAGFLLFLGSGLWAILAAVALYALAPVLVTYNAQLNPRVLGQLFLASSLFLQVIMVSSASAGWLMMFCWAAAVLLAAMAVLTHKMTTQLMLFLWPWWAAALGSWPAAAIPPVAVLVAAAVTGPSYAWHQWQTHWDYISFWFRNWRFLGAHLFRDSPIYGDKRQGTGNLHHVPGMRGLWKHCRTVGAYAPANLLLPFLLLAPQMEVPAWLPAWFFGSYAFALLTLFVPWLRCLGSGYLYVYNAAIPGAIWWAYAVDTLPDHIIGPILFLGLLLTVLSLWHAWRIIGARPSQRDADFEALAQRLGQLAEGRVAVFPLTAAEAVAFKTPHAVLWGGHVFGLKRVEPLFPVVRRHVSQLFAEHGIDYVLWDDDYWPDALQVLANEGIEPAKVCASGKWRLAIIHQNRLAAAAEGHGGA